MGEIILYCGRGGVKELHPLVLLIRVYLTIYIKIQPLLYRKYIASPLQRTSVNAV
jgi:hypothetical protein